jgi:hypothetical protein
MLERLLESRAPVSSLWGLLGDNPKFYYPEVCNPPGDWRPSARPESRGQQALSMAMPSSSM